MGDEVASTQWVGQPGFEGKSSSLIEIFYELRDWNKGHLIIVQHEPVYPRDHGRWLPIDYFVWGELFLVGTGRRA